MPRLLRTPVSALAALLVVAAASPATSSAATSQPQAQRKALAALKVQAGSAPVIVFRQPKLVPRRTDVQQAGADSSQPAQATSSRGRERGKAGITTVAAPVVTRTGNEPAWLFYEDQAPYQSYQHAGRVVLVGATSGRVTISKRLLWPPLIDGKLPDFLASYAAYRAPRYRAFDRSWRLRAPATARGLGTDPLVGGLPAAPRFARAAVVSTPSRRQAADQLAGEDSCAIRISDTLGSFYDAGPVDRTRAELGVVFNQLAALNPGFFTARYRYREGLTPAAFVGQAIARHGCKDVLLYLGGGGYERGAPAVNVGTRGRRDGRVDQQVVTAANVRAILGSHPNVSFKLLIDAPYSGAFLPVVRSAPNLVMLATSSGAHENSFTALAGVEDAQGRPVANGYNHGGYLEFTNRGLQGLSCFLSSPAEVAGAIQAKADGRSRSFLAWMLGRAFSLCGSGYIGDQVDGAPHPVLFFPGGTPTGPTTPGGPTTPAGPGIPVNRAPTATAGSVTTREDVPVGITLAGTDPDGDPLTYTVVSGPTKGTLSGSGATRTYTPDADFNGRDSLSFTVSDGRSTSAPATVSIDVTPVDDAPVLAVGAGTTTFTEAGAPVAVDPGLTVSDVDDDTLAHAKVALGAGFAAGEDELLFTDQSGISGSFDAATGVLDLTGTATKAEYQAALRSVRFRNTSSNPSSAPRDVVFTASDGSLESAPVTRSVAIATVNDPPVLAGAGTTAAFTEDDTTGVAVAPGVTVDDVDSPTMGSATVQITTGLTASEDRLAFVAQNGISGSYDTTTGILTLTGTASKADYQAALRSVLYRDVNTGDPSTAPRTVTLQVDDGASANAASNVVSTSVLVTAVDDAPTVTAGGAAAAYGEGDPPVAVDPAIAVADVDNATLAGATVSIGSGFHAAEDRLAFVDTAAITGSYDAATGVLTLTGTDTVADYQAALRSVTYEDTDGDDPSGATRTVSFTVDDGALDSAAAATDVHVTPVNDAPTLGGGGNTVTFEEDDTVGVVVNPGITVADVDNANLVAATVQIGLGFTASEDQLLFTDQSGISGSYDATTGTLSLSGSASKADYETALRSVKYRNANTGNPSTVPRAISFRVDDGSSVSNVSNSVVSGVDVNPHDDAPTVTAGGGSPTFTEGGSDVTIDPAIAVADVDNATLAGATVSIGSGFHAAEDRLAFVDTAAITGSYDAATGVLTLTGTDTVANYQAALRSVTYGDDNGDDPDGTTRQIAFAVSDGSLISDPATTAVGVTPVDDAPVLTTSSGAAAFVEDGGPVAVDPGIVASDVDDSTLSGAVVTLSGGALAGTPEGQLAFTDTAQISGLWNPLDGTLTLTGTDTVAHYQAALRSITFDDASDTPDTVARTVSFTVSDPSGLDSDAATRDVSVTATNDRPTITAGGGSPTYTEADSPVTVDPAVTVADPDSPSFASATVSIAGGFAGSEDQLVYTAAHGISGSYDAAAGVLTLTGSATQADYQDALRSVQYRDTSSEPSTANRRIDFTVNDGALDSSPAASTVVHVISVNTAPTLGGGGNTVAYSEDDPATIVNGGVTVNDPDDTNTDSARIAITGNLVASEDRLQFTDTASITGSYDASSGVLTLTGSDTKANYQAALRSVRYVNVNHATPSSLSRTVSFTANDGEADSNTITTTITVTPVPDAPVAVAGTGNTKTFTEGGSPVPVDDGFAVSDVDSTNLSGATVAITGGFSALQGDTLGYVAQNGISGSYAAATGVLTLSGSATVADYQAALRTVSFSNTSPAPTTSRTVSFQVTDDTSTASNTVTHAVTILPVNDPPTLAGGGTLGYTENDPATAISPALTASDPDSANLSGASVAITGGFHGGEDALSFVNTASITGTYDSTTGVLTLSGGDTVANYQAALRAVKYVNSSDDPSAAQRTVTYTATDSGGLSGTTTAKINVTPVNDPPVAGADSDSTPGNTRLSYGTPVPNGQAGREHAAVSVLDNDSDPDGPGPLVVDTATSSTTSAQGGNVSWNSDGSFSYVPPAGYTGSDTLTYKVSDQAPTPAEATGTVTITVSGRVWYVANNAAAGGDGRSSAPFTTLSAADSAASATGDRIYVFKGDGTTAGLTGGFSLLAGQKLIGEAQDLQVGADKLFDSTPADRPAISGKVAVGSGNTVTGLQIDGGGGNAIEGTSGDNGGTLDDLTVSGSGGGAGISLNGTSGSWDISNTDVSMGSGAQGISLTNAGTVNFVSAGTDAVHTTNASGLTASGTALSGNLDSATVDASPTGGVALTSTTGSLILDDLNLKTTGTGLLLNNANGVTVRTQSGADGDIVSGGPAVDISNDAGTPAVAPIVGLDQVSSTGGANGLRLVGLGSGTFSANGGTLSGHSDAEVNVGGASSGTINYGGTIGNGSGLSARVNGRSGGTVTLSGNITDSNDSGGGIAMSGNSGGSTTFSGTTKTLNTGTANAVDLTFSGNHTVNFTGGGLGITTTSGKGLTAGGGANGLLSVQGTGNTISSGSGRAIDVNGPDFTSSNATFQSVSSTGADTGINLADTGSAGGLHVTGTPVGSPAASSGGTIASSTGAGVALSNTSDVQLAGVKVTGGADDGIRGTNVTGFGLTGGSQITNNGNAVGERGLDFTELAGTVNLTGATVTGSADDNVAITNDAANLTNLTVDGGTFGNNSTTTGNDGIRIENDGAGSTTGTIKNATFTQNRGDHVQITTDASNTATQNVTVQGNTMNGDGNQPGSTTLGGGITVNPAGNASSTVTLDNNTIKRARDTAIVLNSPLGSNATLKATVTNNHIGTPGEQDSGSATGDGIYVNGHGNSTISTLIQNNDVRRYDNAFGIDLVQNDGDGTLNATVRGNTIAEPGINALSGMRVVVGSDGADGGTSCLDIGDPTNTALKNQLVGTGVSAADLRFRMAGGSPGVLSTAKLAGYTGGATDTAAVNAYLAARNNLGGTPVINSTQLPVSSGGNSVYANAASCPVP